jgi:hypothetical protein
MRFKHDNILNYSHQTLIFDYNLSHMQIFMLPVFFIVFIIYLLYRLFITKDIKKRRWEVYTGFLFIGIWGVVFFVLSRL